MRLLLVATGGLLLVLIFVHLASQSDNGAVPAPIVSPLGQSQLSGHDRLRNPNEHSRLTAFLRNRDIKQPDIRRFALRAVPSGDNDSDPIAAVRNARIIDETQRLENFRRAASLTDDQWQRFLGDISDLAQMYQQTRRPPSGSEDEDQERTAFVGAFEEELRTRMLEYITFDQRLIMIDHGIAATPLIFAEIDLKIVEPQR
jgi:hypothetical protein